MDTLIEAPIHLFTRDDAHWFREGTHMCLHEKLGARLAVENGQSGVRASIWAPRARRVFLTGDFNQWNPESHPLEPLEDSGIWSGFISGMREASAYQFCIHPENGKEPMLKADPFGFWHLGTPRHASVVWDLTYNWLDNGWMRRRGELWKADRPISIYEVHLGSWARVPEEGERFLTYRELATRLADYVSQMGFTHVEFMPVMEHAQYDSLGYQVTGFFAPSGRYGTPQDFMSLVDVLHQRGLGVILDWVPSHFGIDAHGLSLFDGEPLFEYDDPRMAQHPEGRGLVFDYRRPEVRSFLLSSALFWTERYHIDGLRVVSMAPMLRRDIGRRAGQWTANALGGRENLEAIEFLKQFNERLGSAQPDVRTFAEEATSVPLITQPVHLGGLGFSYKWNAGFAQDLLRFMRRDPAERRHFLGELSFHASYPNPEPFVLPISHKQGGSGSGSAMAMMPGDSWRKLANVRLMAGYTWVHPGKKLVFMGNEFAQWNAWQPSGSLDWHLTSVPYHDAIRRWFGDLNHLYQVEPALHQWDASPEGFEWVDCHDVEHCTLSWLRWSAGWREVVLAVCNFTPEVHRNFRVGVPFGGFWREILNSDARLYGGSGQGNLGGVEAAPFPYHGRPYFLSLTLPPLAIVCFKLSRK